MDDCGQGVIFNEDGSCRIRRKDGVIFEEKSIVTQIDTIHLEPPIHARHVHNLPPSNIEFPNEHLYEGLVLMPPHIEGIQTSPEGPIMVDHREEGPIMVDHREKVYNMKLLQSYFRKLRTRIPKQEMIFFKALLNYYNPAEVCHFIEQIPIIRILSSHGQSHIYEIDFHALFFQYQKTLNIPPEIKYLKYLQSICIDGFDIVFFTPEVYSLPYLTTLNLCRLKKIFFCSRLRFRKIHTLKYYLSFEKNNRFMEIINKINPSRFPALKNLDITDTNLNILPKSFFQFPKLQRLILINNKIKQLPEGIHKTKITHLGLKGNLLKSLPDDFSLIDRYFYLSITSNRLTDFGLWITNKNIDIRSIDETAFDEFKIFKLYPFLRNHFNFGGFPNLEDVIKVIANNISIAWFNEVLRVIKENTDYASYFNYFNMNLNTLDIWGYYLPKYDKDLRSLLNYIEEQIKSHDQTELKELEYLREAYIFIKTFYSLRFSVKIKGFTIQL